MESNWHCHQGGGGAIDLVMHLAAADWREAVVWLERHVTGGFLPPAKATPSQPPERSAVGQSHSPLQLPRRDDRLLGRVRTNPPWLSSLIAHGCHIHCGFDTDDAGELAASQRITLYPVVKRLRPVAHDWNDALALRQ